MSSLQLRRPRPLHSVITRQRLIAAVIAAAILGVALAITVALYVRQNRMVKYVQAQLEHAILSDLAMVVRTYDRMSEPKVDINGEILPGIEKHLYSAYMQDHVLVDMQGMHASVIGNQIYSDGEVAIGTLNREVKADRIVNATENALTPFITDVKDILLARLGEGGENNMGGV